MDEIKCVFCEKDMSDEKFREDYTLLAWRDDEEDPESLNKLAKPAHPGCLKRFVALNFDVVRDYLLEVSK